MDPNESPWALAWALVFEGDATLWATVARSLTVSGLATGLACVVGVPLGAWLGVARFPGRAAWMTLLDGLLAVPSVVVGLVAYWMLSRSGPLGFLGWLFSLPAMVMAQTVLVLPVVVNLVRRAVEPAERDHGEQLRMWGAGIGWRAALLAWDERHAVLSAVLLAFSRAVSEVGAVMVVGGNIEGYTRVMTTAIALEASKGDLPLALALGLVLLAVVWALHGLGAWAGRAAQPHRAGVGG
ncbi:Tungstate uptake system permease protein TupB [Tepidimonas alkaliphilus]|uniref:Tungstate uptake system permease protein TupB n=1 Tax=Tepidimonas alkaliphilus TaxID=2588942 RepID=A0A554W8N9_9BURK|nr:ABC transporter permease [Tepidimonas alkaliphilus]TSE19931.1 Tungstate uptake system permease protein TupB [Tepidimonas alkaliphilus]